MTSTNGVLVEGRSWRADTLLSGVNVGRLYCCSELGGACAIDSAGGLLALHLGRERLEQYRPEHLGHCAECRTLGVSSDGRRVAWRCLASDALHIRSVSRAADAAIVVPWHDLFTAPPQLGPSGAGWFVCGIPGPVDEAAEGTAEVHRYDESGRVTQIWRLDRDDVALEPRVVGHRLLVVRERLADGIYLTECGADGSVWDVVRLGDSPGSRRYKTPMAPLVSRQVHFAAVGRNSEVLVFWRCHDNGDHPFRLTRIELEVGRVEVFESSLHLRHATITQGGLLLGHVFENDGPRRAISELVVV